MTQLKFRAFLRSYQPAFALLAAVALVVTLAPSATRDLTITGSGDDLFGGGGPGTDGDGPADGVGGEGPGSPGDGTTGGDGGALSGDGSAGANSAGGRSLPGAPGRDCSRNEVLRGVTCRPPAFAGDNGGATYRGVTADVVNVVFYQPQQNQQVEAALGAAGIPTKAERAEVLAAWEKYLNSVYETYGRKVRLILHYGTSGAADAAGQQADAIHVAEELKAFAVMSPTAGPAFWTELHRRGISGFSNTQYESEMYEDLSPHLLGLLPDVDTTNQFVAEYYCKRLHGRPSVFAGPAHQRQERRFGIIYLDNGRNHLGPRLERQLAAECGAKPVAVIGYSPDVSTASQQATTIVAAMRERDVTTVTCLCDPVFPAHFTKQATAQGWFPEWMHNGLFGTDLVLFGRVYDQQQWSRSFGISAFEYPVPSAEDPAWLAYKKGNPQGQNKNAKAVGTFYFWAARAIFDSIEATGSRLTDETFLRSLFSLPPVQFANTPRMSFGRNGPGPYTATDDVTEVWWSSTREAPDGKPGTFFYVAAGKRYGLGQWPTTVPPAFEDDGSPQPRRDPDAS